MSGEQTYIAISFDLMERNIFEEAASGIYSKGLHASKEQIETADELRREKAKKAAPYLKKKESAQRELNSLKIASAKAAKTKNETLKKELDEKIRANEEQIKTLDEQIKTAGDNSPLVINLKKKIESYDLKLNNCKSALSTLNPRLEKLMGDQFAAIDKAEQALKKDDLTVTRSSQSVGILGNPMDAAARAIHETQQALTQAI